MLIQRSKLEFMRAYVTFLEKGRGHLLEQGNSLGFIKKYVFLTRELSLINTCCWRADHEILMHDGEVRVH